MTDTPAPLPAEYVRLANEYGKAYANDPVELHLPTVIYNHQPLKDARAALDSFVAGLVRERDEAVKKRDWALKDRADTRRTYLRIKEHARRVEAKSQDWKLRYKSERGSFADGMYKLRCKLEAREADLAACRAELAEAKQHHQSHTVPTADHIRQMHSSVPTAWWNNPPRVSPGHTVYAQGNDPCYLCVLLGQLDAAQNELCQIGPLVGMTPCEPDTRYSSGDVVECVKEALASQERLRGALRKYADHARDCASRRGHFKGPEYQCDCGLDAALASEGESHE